MKIHIKQVPDVEPNADGVWVEREIDPKNLGGEYRDGHTLWDKLTKLCDEGHHAVKYRFDDEVNGFRKAMKKAPADEPLMEDLPVFWEHVKTGGRYRVVAVGRMESSREPVVTYRSEHTQEVWVRPQSEFLERFKQIY